LKCIPFQKYATNSILQRKTEHVIKFLSVPRGCITYGRDHIPCAFGTRVVQWQYAQQQLVCGGSYETLLGFYDEKGIVSFPR